MLRLNFEKKIKIKSLVAWSISEGRVDQKQIINFVQPYYYVYKGKPIFFQKFCNPNSILTFMIKALCSVCNVQ